MYVNNFRIFFYSAIEERKSELVIPLRDNAKDLLDRVKHAKQIKTTKTENDIDQRPDSELTLDELAARQLLKGKLFISQLLFK